MHTRVIRSRYSFVVFASMVYNPYFDICNKSTLHAKCKRPLNVFAIFTLMLHGNLKRHLFVKKMLQLWVIAHGKYMIAFTISNH